MTSSSFRLLRSASKLRMILCRKTGNATALTSSLLTYFLPERSACAFAASMSPMLARGLAPTSISSFLFLVVVTNSTTYFFRSLATGIARTSSCMAKMCSFRRSGESFGSSCPSV